MKNKDAGLKRVYDQDSNVISIDEKKKAREN